MYRSGSVEVCLIWSGYGPSHSSRGVVHIMLSAARIVGTHYCPRDAAMNSVAML